ncbi:unnamed protein product [Larinioides sclopetarius]|uniref:Uncharacterized protein n=1 Tax=Larinioides sclopetarius TaxID=280406 RepID=A0AAV1ZZ32_9ARAC
MSPFSGTVVSKISNPASYSGLFNIVFYLAFN